MSWLLVAFIPGLLMLATIGLQRLEEGLDKETVRDEFLDTPSRILVPDLSNKQFPATRQANRV